jgi:hypothetical protein
MERPNKGAGGGLLPFLVQPRGVPVKGKKDIKYVTSHRGSESSLSIHGSHATPAFIGSMGPVLAAKPYLLYPSEITADCWTN